MNKGFGLIGLIITVAIIGLLVWGAWYINGNQKQNQIEQGQAAIDQAKNAAQQENQYNQSVQDMNSSLDTGGGVDYRAATKGLK